MTLVRSLAAVALLAMAAPALAQETASGSAMVADIMVEDGFARATLPGARTGGAYLTIMNHGGSPDRLLSLASPAAGKVAVHEMAMDGEVMRMRALPGGIEIGAGETVSLAPGGLHLMFEGLKQPLVKGSSVALTLTFEKAGPVEIALPVLAPGAKTAGGTAAHDMPGMDHTAN